MPYLMPVSCTHGGCNKTSVVGTSLCPEHTPDKREERNAADRFRYNTGKVRQYYGTTEWKKLSEVVKRRNPICQAIENNVQCQHRSELVHHLISPNVNFELRNKEENLVAICNQHHSNSEGDSGKYQYAPTIGFCDGEVFEHNTPIPYAARTGKPEPLGMIGDGTGKIGTTTSVGDDALDAALAREDW
jgi:hypothetical protein